MGWDRRSIHGFPFRLDVELSGVRYREPSGWGIAARQLSAEAFVFSPTHWVALVPKGVVVIRRRGGQLRVDAKVLRASVSETTAAPPRISVEGLDLVFTAPSGTAPFALRTAKEFHFHTKAGPRNQGAIYLEIDGAVARLDGLIGRIAEGRQDDLVLDGIFTEANSFLGRDWPSAARAWSIAGGRLTIRHLRVSAGRAEVTASAGEIYVGADGGLRGNLSLALRQAPKNAQRDGRQRCGSARNGPHRGDSRRSEPGRADCYASPVVPGGPCNLGPCFARPGAEDLLTPPRTQRQCAHDH